MVDSVSRMLLASGSQLDNTPDAFSFTNQINVERSTLTTSNIVTITNIISAEVSVTGGAQVNINGTGWVSSGTITNNQTLQVRVNSASSFSTAVSITITVGSVSSTWTITTRAADAIPDAFTFTDVTGVEPSTVTTSATITVSGLEPNYSITISASGGTVDAGTSTLSGTFASSKTVTTSGTGTLVVAARVTSSASFTTAVNCTVTIGGVSDIFTATTRAADTTPTAFSFTDATGIELSTVTTSDTITVSGLEPNSSITVSGGSGVTVDAGTSTLSGTYASSKTVTTSGTGTLVVAARVTSSSAYSTAITASINVGSGSTSWNVTTRAADTVPNAFSFTDVTNVEPSTVTPSGTITVTGLEPNYSITITASGGTVDAGTSTLSGTFASSKTVTTSGTGTLVVAARVTSSASFNTQLGCTVTIGGVSDTFSATTRLADTTPDAFTFTDVTGVELSTATTSSTITISGLEPNYSVTVSASGGTVDAGTSTLSGTFASSKTVTTSATGTIVVAARVTSSASFSTVTSCTVTTGGVSDSFDVTTRAPDTVGVLSIPDINNAALSSTITSSTVTVTELEPNYSFTVSASGGTVDAGTSTLSGTFAASKTVTSSATGTLVVAARVTSSSSFTTAVNCTVTVGSSSDVFTVTTRAADTVPNAFSFTDVTNVEPSTVTPSGTITVSELEPNFSVTVSASGGTVDAGTSSLSGTFAASKTVTTSGSGTLVVAARVTSSASFSTPANCTVTIGGVSDTFTATTRAANTTPAAFSFTDQTGVALATTITSGTITVTGLEPNFSVTVSASGGTVDAGTSSLSGVFASSKTVTTSATGTLVVAARVTSSSAFTTAVDCTVTIGGISDTFTATTRGADLVPETFSFTSSTNVERSTVTPSGTITVSGLEPNFPVTVSASGGTVDAGTSSLSGTFASSKTVTTSGSGQLVVAARGTSSSSFSTSVQVTVTVGNGAARTYTITTRAADTTPTAFSFTDVTNAELSTVTPSGTITVSGLEPNFSITVSASGGTVDAGTSSLSGTFASSKTVTTSGSGQLVVAARVTSSGSYSTAVNCTVTIGSGSDTFTVTTKSVDVTFSGTTTIYVQDGVINNYAIGTFYSYTGVTPSTSMTMTKTGGTSGYFEGYFYVGANESEVNSVAACNTSKIFTTSGSGSFGFKAAGATGSRNFYRWSNSTYRLSAGGVNGSTITAYIDTAPSISYLNGTTPSENFPAGGTRFFGMRFSNCGSGTAFVSVFSNANAADGLYSFDTVNYYRTTNAASVSISDGGSFDIWIAITGTATVGATNSVYARVQHSTGAFYDLYVYNTNT